MLVSWRSVVTSGGGSAGSSERRAPGPLGLTKSSLVDIVSGRMSAYVPIEPSAGTLRIRRFAQDDDLAQDDNIAQDDRASLTTLRLDESLASGRRQSPVRLSTPAAPPGHDPARTAPASAQLRESARPAPARTGSACRRRRILRRASGLVRLLRRWRDPRSAHRCTAAAESIPVLRAS